MLFFTFFSRSILYLITPKVIMSPPSYGLIREEIRLTGSFTVSDGETFIIADITGETADLFEPGQRAMFIYRDETGEKRADYAQVTELRDDTVILLPNFAVASECMLYSLTVYLTDGYYGLSIPSHALIPGNFVYVARKENGLLGEEIFIDLREVETGVITRDYIEITGGLSQSDMIITGWDRELRDGCRVMPPLD